MTPLILLPGMMCDARLFGPQINALSSRVPLMTVPLGRHNTIAALAEDFLSFAPLQFALAGLSMGGIVAMEILRQAPDRVRGLALMDTNPLAENDEVKKGRKAQIASAEAGHLERVMREEMKPNYLVESPGREGILDLCLTMALDLGPDVFIKQSQALRDRTDQTETLRAFELPTLILCGQEDTLCPVSRHQLMHDLMPNSIFKIIESAGHLPTLEQPQETTAALARWLETI